MQVVDDRFWLTHGVSLSDVDRLPLLRKDRLRRILRLEDEVKARHSPQRRAEQDAMLIDAKRKAGQL